ncbi:MAG: lyase [Gammaproteobacteria bacterium]|nr:lyase [Gammaproteobacteria bacterium]
MNESRLIMREHGMGYVATLVALSIVWIADSVAADVESVQITEWRVPWENTRPRDPYVDSQRRVWFVGQAGDYVARLDPSTGTFTRFELDSGTGPHNLVMDGNGRVWYAGNRDAHIGELDPEGGDITKYPMPIPAAKDPHTLVFDEGGDIWFTVQWGNYVGKLTPSSGHIDLIPVPTARARPYGIVIDPDDRPWITEFGSNKLATVDVETMELEELALPRGAARPRRLAATSDGAIWYVDYAQGYLGRVDPATSDIKEWRVPGGDDARPYGMAVDDRDRLWFVETGPSPNRFVGFDPVTESFFSVTEIASGGGSVRHMYYDKSTGAIWFGTDTNTIGRARIP